MARNGHPFLCFVVLEDGVAPGTKVWPLEFWVKQKWELL